MNNYQYSQYYYQWGQNAAHLQHYPQQPIPTQPPVPPHGFGPMHAQLPPQVPLLGRELPNGVGYLQSTHASVSAHTSPPVGFQAPLPAPLLPSSFVSMSVTSQYQTIGPTSPYPSHTYNYQPVNYITIQGGQTIIPGQSHVCQPSFQRASSSAAASLEAFPKKKLEPEVSYGTKPHSNEYDQPGEDEIQAAAVSTPDVIPLQRKKLQPQNLVGRPHLVVDYPASTKRKMRPKTQKPREKKAGYIRKAGRGGCNSKLDRGQRTKKGKSSIRAFPCACTKHKEILTARAKRTEYQRRYRKRMSEEKKEEIRRKDRERKREQREMEQERYELAKEKARLRQRAWRARKKLEKEEKNKAA